jgi:hypothetical protein
MTVKTSMFVFALTLAPAVMAQADNLTVRPALDSVRLVARYEGAQLKASLDCPDVRLFAGIVVASPWKKTLHFAGLPPILAHVGVIGFGVSKTGHLDFAVPGNPGMDLYLQAATLADGDLQITQITMLSGSNMAEDRAQPSDPDATARALQPAPVID